ncbi:MAG: HAMP domain-containing sensor histidine kinase [Vicinamibacterales bacterium]
MTRHVRAWTRRALGPYGFVAMGIAVATLLLLCYRAIAEWQHSAQMLADRRAQTAVDLLVTAFTRDMRGVQMNILAPAQVDDASDLANRVTSGFARYPYPEVFLAWPDTTRTETMVFYSRSGRSPAWLHAGTTRHLPVATGAAPAVAAQLAERFAHDAARHRRFSIVNFAIDTADYQVVVLLTYRDSYREHVTGAFGFLVNLDWVRKRYFRDLTMQVGRIAGLDEGIALRVRDENGQVVVAPSQRADEAVLSTRAFPVAFFDPIVAGIERPAGQAGLTWHADAIVTGEPALLAAAAGARGTLGIAFAAGLLLVVTYGVMVRVVKETNRLAEMRSSFVATVTHELKTPLATIRMVGETFASGEEATLEMSQRFAKVSVNEAKRLTRLIDNLLAYARVTDVTDLYQFEALSPEAIVDEVMDDFATQLAGGGFDVRRDVPSGLPQAWADRTSVRLMMSNLVDNAIRYAGTARRLVLRAYADDRTITIDVEDGGIGIAEPDLPHVTRRFFRGHSAGPGGSGLGLAIVERIVTDHGGTLAIASTVGTGTRVSVTLPLAGGRS